MAKVLNCVFCSNSSEEVVLFSEQMLKQCKRVLNYRKEHNLKYKDVVLPNREYEGGYHKGCQKLFTALMKKYCRYKSNKPKSVKKRVLNDSEYLCQETSVHKLSTQSIEQSSVTLTPSPIKLLVPVIRLERIKLNQVKPSTFRENEQLENTNSSSEIKTRPEYKRNICIYCDRTYKTYRQNKQRLYTTEKDKFLLKITRENNEKFYDKIVKNPDSKIYYHNTCKLRFCFATPLVGSQIIGVNSWYCIRQYHQKAFKKISTFILKNVVKKERCYFLSYIFKIYLDYLAKKSQKSEEDIAGFLSTHRLGDQILKVLRADVKILVVQRKKILAPKKLEVVDDELFKKLKGDNQSLVKQFRLYQGNFQEENSNDEAENLEDVDDTDELSVL
ncbi:uncharacterized protein LOC123269827 [Cotesia glomerata]|uniref:Uncharacterized protein n=1 Tax=Cotesia glomerata TaxID=32391 RepID=A0AAV7I6V5_COTGL|nr:uncharacterized protein LOC123269827 [Cotesia glomerata]KAH0545896.1 hypothetical protein KQX54_004228 [Cotesia glomerata]